MGLKDTPNPLPMLRGYARRAVWQPMHRVYRPPVDMRPWLEVKTSLTRQLEHIHGPMHVGMIRQHVCLPLRDEAGVVPRPCVVRDVVLKAEANRVLIFAHSLLPLAPRGVLYPMLKRLGKQALGSLLFTRPGFVRRQREWALLDCRHPLYRSAQAVYGNPLPKRIWARRASFSAIRKPQQSVQVTELFLDVQSA